MRFVMIAMNNGKKLNEQEFKLTVSDLVMSITIWILFFIIYLTISSYIPEDQAYHYAFTTLSHLAAIVYLYLKAQRKLSAGIGKVPIYKFIILGMLISAALHVPYMLWLNKNTASEVFTSLYGYTLLGKVLYLLIICLFLPVVEEILFRYYYYRIIKENYGAFIAVGVSVSLFVGVHSFQSMNLLNLCLQGFIYTYVYEKTGSIKGSILVHSFNNSIWFIVTYMASIH